MYGSPVAGVSLTKGLRCGHRTLSGSKDFSPKPMQSFILYKAPQRWLGDTVTSSACYFPEELRLPLQTNSRAEIVCTNLILELL